MYYVINTNIGVNVDYTNYYVFIFRYNIVNINIGVNAADNNNLLFSEYSCLEI